MSTADGQSANAATFNAAYVSKTVNSTTVGQVTLNNADSSSGTQVTNIQRELNALSAWTGKALNVAKDTTPTWTDNDIGASTDSTFDRIDGVGVLFKALAASGHSHTGVDGQGPLIDLTSAVTGDLPIANIPDTLGKWNKYTVAASSLSAASGANDIELFSLAAHEMIEGVVLKHTTAFSGASITDYKVDIGPTAQFDRYIDSFDADQTVAASAFDAQAFSLDVQSFTATTSIRVRAISTGDDLDGASAGEFDVWIKRSSLE